jgi:hypothetical protein
LKRWEASHERKQLARALKRADEQDSTKKREAKGKEKAIAKLLHYHQSPIGERAKARWGIPRRR